MAKKHIEALEMAPKYKSFSSQEPWSMRNRSVRTLGKFGKNTAHPGAPLSSVRPKKFDGEKAVHLWIEGTEVRRQPVDQSEVFVFPN
jgi:hypothetical protein